MSDLWRGRHAGKEVLSLDAHEAAWARQSRRSRKRPSGPDGVSRAETMTRHRFWLLALLGGLALGAGPLPSAQVDTWASASAGGPLILPGEWQLYPRSSLSTFKYPPAIVIDGGHPVLQLKTDHESIGIWRAVHVDIKATPLLVWEWKPLLLPAHGDVRQPTRNDQVARVMVLFKGRKAILYVWDTNAPVGVEVRPDMFGAVDRVLIVVRSGPSGVGQRHREKRDVSADYKRIFEEEPRAVRWVGLESHSDDVRSQSAVRFGQIRFERR